MTRALLALQILQCSWSYKGGQGLGFFAAVLALARTREMRRRVMDEYRGLSNTNPFMAGPLVGVLVHHERRGDALAHRLAGALQSGFGSVGDEFFWRVLRPSLAAIAVLAALFGFRAAPFVLLVPFALASQGLMLTGLVSGLRHGREAGLELTRRLSGLARVLGPATVLLVGMLAARGLAVARPTWLFVAAGAMGWLLLGSQRRVSLLLVGSLLILLVAKVVL